MRILVIEDEQGIADNVAEYLRQRAFAVDVAYDGESGWTMAQSAPYDAVLLDWMLPGVSGMEICRRLRAVHPDAAILLLTARDALGDKVEGLDTGADDYLVKPFELKELLSRINALIRRRYSNQPRENVLRVGNLSLNLATQQVRRGKEDIRLTRKLFQLLEFLMRNKDRVVSKAEIEAHVWDAHAELWSDVVRSHVQKLREKVDRGFDRRLIQTLRGMGYTISDRPHAQ